MRQTWRVLTTPAEVARVLTRPGVAHQKHRLGGWVGHDVVRVADPCVQGIGGEDASAVRGQIAQSGQVKDLWAKQVKACC